VNSRSFDVYLKNLCLWYDEHLLFHNLNWSLPSQQWTCLLGQSGIGKSTLLRLITGLSAKNSKLQGTVLITKPLAYLGQNDALLPWLTVFDNACLSARLGSYSKTEKRMIKKRAQYLLQRVGLEAVSNFYPRQLSGGMRQRVALVRTLVEENPLIVLDEPFSRLDAITRYQLQNLAVELLKNKTVLFVTHDPAEALRLGDRIDLLSGQPATIKTFARFTTSGPRDLSSPEILTLQKKLYQILSAAYSNHSGLQPTDHPFALKTAGQ